jgi:hypothetical protein
MEDVIRNEFIKLIGKDITDTLVEECDVLLTQFGKDQSKLISKYVDLLKEKQHSIFRSHLNNFPEHIKTQVACMIVGYSVDALYCMMIMHAADCAIMTNTKISVFVSRVMYLWEDAINLAKEYKADTLDLFIKSRPEPSKENLS